MVKVCILTGYGINSDYESQQAFRLAGAKQVDRIHLKRLITGKNTIQDYHILMIPGGFAFGDHLGSGKVMANKFKFSLREELSHFIENDKLIIGICNGFQILVKMGILPGFKKRFKQTVSLIGNDSGHYEDRWVKLKMLQTNCIWTKNFGSYLEVPVRHGEGKFVVKSEKTLEKLSEKNLICMTYSPNEYPNNPNGSIKGIAGICDQSGRIFGMMPHPECFMFDYHYPKWTRDTKPAERGLKIFKNGVTFAQDYLV